MNGLFLMVLRNLLPHYGICVGVFGISIPVNCLMMYECVIFGRGFFGFLDGLSLVSLVFWFYEVFFGFRLVFFGFT